MSRSLRIGDHAELAALLCDDLRSKYGRVRSDNRTIYRHCKDADSWIVLPQHVLSCILQSYSGREVSSDGGHFRTLRITSAAVSGAIRLACAQLANRPESAP
jgi:hypothetical protein